MENCNTPPANEVCRKVKNTDVVLFLGSCGAFRGKVNESYLPVDFWEMDFDSGIIRPVDTPRLLPKNKIHYDNILVGLVPGKKSVQATSNITLAPKLVEDEDKGYLQFLANILLQYADAVDKEMYPIVKLLGGKFPLGLLAVSYDVVGKEELMMQEWKTHWDENKFKEACVNAVKTVVANLLVEQK